MIAQTFAPDLSQVISILTINNVDFAVSHGVNQFGKLGEANLDQPDNGVRTALIATFNVRNLDNIDPDKDHTEIVTVKVRIDFGDRKYGQRVSRVHIDGDHRKVLPINEVYRLAELNRVSAFWRTSATIEKQNALAKV